MTAAALSRTPIARHLGKSSATGLAAFAKRVVNALVASRARTAEVELRRHGFAADGLRAPDLLPFKL